jgi:ribosome biogenesis GTPase
LPSGIIIKGISGFYYVESDNGLYECKARGIFRKNELTPLPGDRVEFSVTDLAQRKGSLDRILDRTTLLARPAVANVNQLVAVIAAKMPEPDLLLLDKLLVTSEKNGMKAVLCINKIDLDPDDIRRSICNAYTNAGYLVLETSSRENKGFHELKAALNGHISVFAGQSGVGKSTLLNMVMNTMVMKTGGLSDKIERGRHTTRHAELIEIEDGGYVADTPGFSSFELAGIERAELQHCYPEFEPYKYDCRFTGCSHLSEPDCGVKRALAEGSVDEGRYGRYAALYAFLKQEEDMKYKKKQ